MLGYAVIDTETTGLNIRHNDRIIEIAVVLLDGELNITGSYETVLNPERDLGLVSLHGIDGLIASEGASFKEIIPTLSALLHDRVIIGHNVKFDIGMLECEYKKEGIAPNFGVYVDTLQIAKSLRKHFGSYKLENLCESFGISIPNSHQAMADTIATAKLLVAMLNQYQPHVECFPADFNDFIRSTDFSSWKSRAKIQQKIYQPAHLNDYILTLQDTIADLPEKSIEIYLKNINLALMNYDFSIRERTKMEELISQLSLTRRHVIDLNEEYIFMLICKNLTNHNGQWVKNNLLTEKIQVASNFTGVTENSIEDMLRQTLQQRHLIDPTVKKLDSYFSLIPGDSFVITGEDFEYSKDHWVGVLTDQGYILKSDTTKKTKFVVAGDPYSLSAKAVTARKYEIPVLSESSMLKTLGL